ncbi:aromatic amino acid transport family protein [Ferrimonas pelagia]|uniref:Aromatic amino acid transport family protein n=1 Tax=Ferrimonas pelagia TaxID=1177826 RepID=A0ABP9EHW5_9GAMM
MNSNSYFNSKSLGATLIVAGTAIGAGMLALPIATAAIGFWPALALMVGLWALSGYSALLMLEVNLKVGAQLDTHANLHTMTGHVLGRAGQWVGALANLALLYSLTAAYLSGGASLLMLKLGDWLALSHGSAALLFALTLGAVVALGMGYIDRMIRLLFSAKLLALLAVLVVLLPDTSALNLLADATEAVQGQGALIAAIPVIITSFGFHVCIPSLVRYLQGDVISLRRALLIGSALPLLCYSLWLLATLGVLSPAEQLALAQGDALANLVVSLSERSGQSWLGTALTAFADLALLTSFLGVTLSLFDYLAELSRRNDSAAGRGQTWLLTFLLPLGLAIFYPQGFVAILGFAAIPLMVYMVILPVLMARKLRTQGVAGYQVRGGTPALALITAAALGVIAAQLVTAL